MANTIKIKRGLSSNIDNTTLAQGELAITTDTNELYVGIEGGKKRLGSDVVIIYGTDDESTVVKKLAEAIDGPDLTGNPAKIKKECIYYETGVPEWSRIYKLVNLASSVVESPFTSVTFLGGYGTLTMKIERGEEVNGEYQYIITKTTDSYEQISNKIDEIGVKSYVSSSEYPSEKAVIEYVTSSINNIQEIINIQKDSSITDEGIGKLDIASANIFTATTEPHFYKVGVADTTLHNGILYNGIVPFKNVADNSLVRIQKDAVIYYAGGVAYCFTGEGIYSLLWDDTEKKGWVTKVKMDNESYYIYEKQDSLPNVTVTAGDFTWDATERTLTATGAASTTKTATIKFNEAVDGVYFSLSNNSGTGRMGILSAKVNNEDYYIGLLQGLGTEYTQWNMQKDDVLTITYQGDSTSTADETFVFKIEHWQKSAQTTSVASYTNYAIGNSELNEQMTTARISQEVANLRYDLNNLSTGSSSNILTIADATGTRGITVTNSGEEWRLLGNSGIDGLIYTLPTSMPEEFTSHVTFKAAYGCTVTVENWTPHYSGDDVANGIFTPVEGTVYDLAFYWNGFYVVCIIKGTN